MHSANRRLAASGSAGVVLAAVVAFVAPWQIAVLAGWCAAAIAFLAQVARGVANADADTTQAIATREDPSHLFADAALISAAASSLIGVAFVLRKAGESTGPDRALVAGFGAVAVALAWTTVQTIYTLRYAREYYGDRVGGINFGGEEPPDYHDFAYLAFTVGMTYQVSDTTITAHVIRRTVLRHAILSFVFATAFIAVLVNVVGGLL